jgi:hypothetical protein
MDDTYELSPEGNAHLMAVDSYLAEAIEEGRPLETLVATKRLGQIIDARARDAARAATAGSASWTDVGKALGVSRQAAHEKLRAHVRDQMEKGRSKMERAEQAGRAKIRRRATRGREGLDKAVPSPTLDLARQRIDDWEKDEHDKLTRKMEKAREDLKRAERSVETKLNR